MFLHGFPSHADDWLFQVQHFSARGYGIVAPDLLGYGETSKPSDIDNYRLKPMSDELVELIDSLGLRQVIGVGHDFGATLLSRAAAYHPSRWIAFVFLAVGPPRLGTPFDVNEINRMTKEAMGQEMLGYIPWLGGDISAQSVLEEHAEAAMSIMFPADAAMWDEWFHPLEKLKAFVQGDLRVPVGEWYPEELRGRHLGTFSKPDGYRGVVRWYRMLLENLFSPDEVGFENYKIQQPVLFVVPKMPETSAAQQQQMLADWAPQVETAVVDSGHWVHLERRSETNKAIEVFLNKL